MNDPFSQKSDQIRKETSINYVNKFKKFSRTLIVKENRTNVWKKEGFKECLKIVDIIDGCLQKIKLKK